MQESLDASLVRIRTPEGRVGGAGFLVGEQQILCPRREPGAWLGECSSPMAGAILPA
jgi:hypothetical protein